MPHPPTARLWLAERLTQPFGSECVEWPFSKDRDGYGQLGQDGTTLRVSHRVLEFFGFLRPNAPDDCALHSCDNPPCMNPEHLRWGTQGDNATEKSERGRCRPQRGVRNINAILTEENINEIFVIRSLGFSYVEIASMFGVKKATINNVLNRRSWKHVQV